MKTLRDDVTKEELEKSIDEYFDLVHKLKAIDTRLGGYAFFNVPDDLGIHDHRIFELLGIVPEPEEWLESPLSTVERPSYYRRLIATYKGNLLIAIESTSDKDKIKEILNDK